MQLRKIKLTNFRGYRNTTEINIDEGTTGIVGCSDLGKFTIPGALTIFFGTEGTKADRNDMNCFSLREGASRFEIVCEFDGLPESIIIDERVQTTLVFERLLNKDGNLGIVRSFKATTTGKPEQICIRYMYPAYKPLRNLMGTKMAELRTVGKAIEESVANKHTTSLWRQTIREAAVPYDCTEILLDVDEKFGTSTKSLWGRTPDLLPTFALLKADRENGDGDSEAKNPFQQAVKDAQVALRGKVAAFENETRGSVLDITRRTLDKLWETAPELTSELTSQFREKPKWTFSFTLDGENGIPINRRGSGARWLTLLNFLRTEAKRVVTGTRRNVIYAIKEPETFQHSNCQVLLIRALLVLACQPHRQIIVTTHVPALAGLISIDSVRYIIRDRLGEPVVKIPDHAVPKEAMESLGVLPETGMERVKDIVPVEGKSDVISLRHAIRPLKQSGVLSACLEDVSAVSVLIGGCRSVKHWVTLSLTNDLGLSWCVFLDFDTGGDSSQTQSAQKRKREVRETGRVFSVMRKREVENYPRPDLIHELTGVQATCTDTCDAKKVIGRAVGMEPNSVLDIFWPRMTGGRILTRSACYDSIQGRVELKEILTEIISMVH